MQPSSRHDWNKHSIQRKVSLENAFVGGNNGMVLVGLIRVWNIAYEKKVFVRYSTDNWSSYVDLPAEFMSQSHEGTIDKYVFKLLAPVGLAVGDTIEFAVCYCVNEQKHWDNNKGNNYIVKCCG
ncbi:predicted protein [Nematostella vectensis]|uniref:CBM21 domain-containing protein n=1 Tax=Nematostella vectensis TaxID=45351 RepID=A7RN47_NEMVE|nr:predicted protein [Nematostella vectensis]|eukprot:XP_001639135.1 predicted protein [Nematostella vectensis]